VKPNHQTTDYHIRRRRRMAKQEEINKKKKIQKQRGNILQTYVQKRENEHNVHNPKSLADLDFFSKSLPNDIYDIVRGYNQSVEEQLVDFFSNYLPYDFFDNSKINSMQLPKFMRVFKIHVKKIHVCMIGKLTGRVYFNFNTWDDGCILTSENLSMIKTSIEKITSMEHYMSIIQMGWIKRV
jgi:hypothetical protein